MKNERKIVDVDVKETKEKITLDREGKIVKAKDVEAISKEGAKPRRICAVILWVLAIACEIVAVLNIFNKLTLPDKLGQATWLVILIVLDLIFVVCGSLLWKKANHIDPYSEKNKTAFWTLNNLGTLLSVLAFLPLIIFVLTNKDMDKKSKTIVTAVAAIAMIIAGVSSYDFNPVSLEQLEHAEKEVQSVSGNNIVYWAPHSKKYHVDPDCPAFSQSETVYEGTVKQAYEHNLTDPCRRCIPELKEEE